MIRRVWPLVVAAVALGIDAYWPDCYRRSPPPSQPPWR